jgi:hypothetical protein
MQELETLVTTTCPPKVSGDKRRQFANRYEALRDMALEYSSPAKHQEIMNAFDTAFEALGPVLPLLRNIPPRALAPEFEAYVWSIVNFYRRYGGHPSQMVNSPCERFVRATAEETLREAGWGLTPGTVSGLVRRALRHLEFATPDLAVARPDIGAPSLGINQPPRNEPWDCI